ncbi:PAS domain-containing protein [Noviherbaspirillum pedocola]
MDVIALLGESERFVHLNEAAVEILGYQPQKLLGRHYADLLYPVEP